MISKSYIVFNQPVDGKSDDEPIRPELAQFPRAKDIFRIRRAEYEEAWETNFLLSVIPILVRILDFSKIDFHDVS